MANVKDLKWGLAASYSFITDTIKYFKKQRVFLVSGCIFKTYTDYDDCIRFTDIVPREDAEIIFKEIMDAPRKPLVEDLEDMLPF